MKKLILTGVAAVIIAGFFVYSGREDQPATSAANLIEEEREASPTSTPPVTATFPIGESRVEWQIEYGDGWNNAYDEAISSRLKDFPQKGVTRLTKFFKSEDMSLPEGSPRREQDLKLEEKAEKQIKDYLVNTGWVMIGQSEPNGYMSYLYTKDGSPLLLSTGRRMPVWNGVYIMIQYLIRP